MTYQVDILNPKATRLLQDLADLDLITMRPSDKEGFMQVVSSIRKKAEKNPPTLEDITKEVESVRKKRYEQKKK